LLKKAGCNVVGITVHGCIMTYAPAADEGTSGVPEGCDAMTVSEEIMNVLDRASMEENIRIVLLDIDSGGGQPQAAVEIESALKASGIPSVAWIRAYGNSAAYWVASAADTVIASKESDIGSIGVTASYLDNAKQNAQEGLTYNSISTGKYKDAGSPDKSLTADERAMLEKSNRTTLENFIGTIATNRELSIEKVRALADGSSWLGEEALSLGLIDKLGTYPEVLAHLREGLEEEPVICWQ
jgi:protease-4